MHLVLPPVYQFDLPVHLAHEQPPVGWSRPGGCLEATAQVGIGQPITRMFWPGVQHSGRGIDRNEGKGVVRVHGIIIVPFLMWHEEKVVGLAESRVIGRTMGWIVSPARTVGVTGVE
jgi:hypothetical protein